MLRVFLIRIIKKKNPFSPDRSHLHHLLVAQGLNRENILTLFFLLILIPILISFFTNLKPIYLILFNIIFYIIIIYKLKNFSEKN
jgi:UDP-N-acetylmuramyl pentapeptide phosphotransferase/UDP-N-acetylglucosamine-1-phosphate transferase